MNVVGTHFRMTRRMLSTKEFYYARKQNGNSFACEEYWFRWGGVVLKGGIGALAVDDARK